MNEQTRKALELAREALFAPMNTTKFHQAIAAIDAALANAAPVARCLYCDDTGDVHTPTGEWRGRCTCAAGAAPAAPVAQEEPCRFPGCQFTGCPTAGCYAAPSPAPASQPVSEPAGRWTGDDAIESPHNACQHRGYCLSLKAAPRAPLTDEQLDRAIAAERDALLDHIYEHGTNSEGVMRLARKLAQRAYGIGQGDA